MLDLDLQPDTWALRTVLTADQRIARLGLFGLQTIRNGRKFMNSTTE